MDSPASRGATLIDTVVSTALMLVVFLGIVGAFQLSVEVVTNNKARAGAIALANERQEYIRSLDYDAVGTAGGVPSGSIQQTEALEMNGINYTRRTLILYADDPKDGSGGADTNGVVTDYKVAKTEVSWIAKNGGTRKITLTTRVSPVGVESAVPGGTLAFTIQNANSAPVQDAQVTIVNNSTVPTVNLSLFSDASGIVNVIGAPVGAGYQITISKSGYSTDRTYSVTAENTDPTPGHLTVGLNQTTSATFSIDLLATKNIRTFSPVTSSLWVDAFDDDLKLSATSSTVVDSGLLRLEGDPGSYPASGTARSDAVAPADLYEWTSLSWNENVLAQTDVLYQVYNGAGTALVPDAMIPGNSAGLDTSPVLLTNVSTTTYTSLSVFATLSSSDPTRTPEVESWSIAYEYGPIPLPDIDFGMQGVKTVGSGPGGTVYKYPLQTFSTGPTAGVGIGNLEWDTYTLTVDASTGYDISSSCSPQPEALSPSAYMETRLILSPHTTNSLLVDVRSAGGALVPDASVRLTRGAYDTTVTSDSCGQAFFSGLSAGTTGGGNPYSIEVTAGGFLTYNAADVDVSGTSKRSVLLNN